MPFESRFSWSGMREASVYCEGVGARIPRAAPWKLLTICKRTRDHAASHSSSERDNVGSERRESRTLQQVVTHSGRPLTHFKTAWAALQSPEGSTPFLLRPIQQDEQPSFGLRSDVGPRSLQLRV